MEREQSQAPEPRPGDGAPAAGASDGDSSPERVAQPRGDSLEAQLAKAQGEAIKFRDNWHRAEADFQNYKRRTEHEREESRKFANVSVIINLLPVLDDFERAFGSLDSRLAGLSWFDGIYLIYRKLQQLLENSGVTPIQAEGQAFDPRLHEAVAHAEGEEGKVISEVQRGYRLHDRVLRPAMVVVGKGQEPGARSQEQEEGRTQEGQSQ